MLVTAEEPHTPGRLEHAPQYPAEVVLYLGAGGLLVEAVVVATYLPLVGAERHRIYAVVARGRVQADKRVAVAPMATWVVSPVDEKDVGLGLRDQGVGEGETARAGTHDQVVGVQHDGISSVEVSTVIDSGRCVARPGMLAGPILQVHCGRPR